MNRAGEPFDRHGLGSEYASALREYVEGAGEAALARAYELGRTAAAAGLGVLDMVAMHKAALEALPAGAKEARITGLATQFLSESLSPFEMTLRAYQQNVRLLGLSETLARQNEEIDRAREQLRSILDATTAVIYLTDTDGRYLFVNRQFERVFGLPRQDVIGRRVEDVVQDGVATASPEHSRQILEQGAAQEIEETIMHEDGPHTYLSLKVPLAGSSERLTPSAAWRPTSPSASMQRSASAAPRRPPSPRTGSWRRSATRSPTTCARRCEASTGSARWCFGTPANGSTSRAAGTCTRSGNRSSTCAA